jgi:CRP-like cAMP-binding protein
MITKSPDLSGNRLLARLSSGNQTELQRDLQLVPLKFAEVLYEAHARISYAYFPVRGLLSAIIVMEDGSGIEAATVGNEGMLGLPALISAGTSPYRVIVQGAGEAFRIKSGVLKKRLEANSSLRLLFDLYQSVFLAQVSQSVACNGLHQILPRCCRWLLQTHDRMRADEFALTQEFLSIMLGVRRASVAEVLKSLSDLGLIQIGRAKITILDRAGLQRKSCECYRAINREYERLL